MSYEPTVWKDGDLVTSAKLNKLEQGVANGGGSNVVIGVEDDDGNITLESTWQEIWDNNYTMICINFADHKAFCPIHRIYTDNYSIIIEPSYGGTITLYATNANDYPTYTESGGGDQ